MLKILTKKKQEEILRRIAENGAIIDKQFDEIKYSNMEKFEKVVENDFEIAFAIAGPDGVLKMIELRQKLRKNIERECDGR